MTFLQAIVFGLVQGLGEFLPISSSAHLTLLPWVMGWADPGLAFDVALHIGTLIALLIFFRRDLARLLVALVASLRERRIGDDADRRLVWLVGIGSIPGAIIGLLLEKKAEAAFRDPKLIAIALATMGVILYAVDRAARAERTTDELTVKDALLIGIAQGVAVIPGVSRSGATITAGRLSGLDRAAAARFSFLLSIPITAGAALVKVPKLIHAGGFSAELVVGVIVAGVTGYLALGGLMAWLRTRSYFPFAIYRVAVAAIVLTLALR